MKNRHYIALLILLSPIVFSQTFTLNILEENPEGFLFFENKVTQVNADIYADKAFLGEGVSNRFFSHTDSLFNVGKESLYEFNCKHISEFYDEVPIYERQGYCVISEHRSYRIYVEQVMEDKVKVSWMDDDAGPAGTKAPSGLAPEPADADNKKEYPPRLTEAPSERQGNVVMDYFSTVVHNNILIIIILVCTFIAIILIIFAEYQSKWRKK